MKELEEGSTLQLDFAKLQKIAGTGHHVLPVVVQDAESKEVLVVAYANRAALEHSLKTGIATFWSTSRNELWIKGATSGDTLKLVGRAGELRAELAALSRPHGRRRASATPRDAEGHTRKTCYYRSLRDGKLDFVEAKSS